MYKLLGESPEQIEMFLGAVTAACSIKMAHLKWFIEVRQDGVDLYPCGLACCYGTVCIQ